MGKQHGLAIDPEISAGTALRSAQKREAHGPEAVESIAIFCNKLAGGDPAAALEFIGDGRAEGVTRHGVYLGQIGAAASELAGAGTRT